jgi:hypothetical protein
MKRRSRAPEAHTNAPISLPPAVRAASGRGRIVFLASLFAAALVIAFLAYRWLRPGLPEGVVGQWRVQGGAQTGALLEFRRDGSFQALMDWPGEREKGVVEARVEIEGETIRFLSVNPVTRREEAKTQTIKQLTETEMILEDQRGARSKLIRVE